MEAMADLVIKAEDSTPYVNFKVDGELKFEGRSLTENPINFYNSLIVWVKKLKVEKVKIIMKIEYMNTSSTKMFLEFLKQIENNKKFKQVKIDWYYESDDYDMLELGELFQDNLEKSKLHFIECVDLE